MDHQHPKEHKRRKLKELNLLDDFLFHSMVNYPEIGVRFARLLLRTIFQREIGELEVTAQKVYYGRDTDLHGARLDVCVKESDARALAQPGSIFDMEPDLKDDKESIAGLPRRARFYHSVIDTESLRSGGDYQMLRNVVVILITPFDPFGKNRMQYTIRSRCVEVPDLPYDDGMFTVFLNTRGKEGIPSRELEQLLRYMEETVPKNAVNPDLKSLQQMVDTVKEDKEVSRAYMKSWEIEEMWYRRGQEKERENTEKERRRAEEEHRNVEKERRKAEEEHRNVEKERRNVEKERRNTEEERRRADRAEDEAKKAQAKADQEILRLCEEIARLKAELQKI